MPSENWSTTIHSPQVLSALVLSWLIWRIQRAYSRKVNPSLRSVAIVVLGDIGRSPRMMYHAESFAKSGFGTYIIGYGGSTEIPSLRSQPRVRFLYLSELPKEFSKLPFILLAPIKIVFQVTVILRALFLGLAHPPEFILVQNPPSIPTLALVWLVGLIRGSKVIIDWHNLGYSILALKLGNKHPFVKIAKRFEAFFGRKAYAHLFVTKAMRDHLVQKWKLQGIKVVLHDRPPQHFHRASAQEMHELFFIRHPLPMTLNDFFPPYEFPYSTPFTIINLSNNSPLTSLTPPIVLSQSTLKLPVQRKDRPALLVSSTSWTPDEDFGLLLEALKIYEKRARSVNTSIKESKNSEADETTGRESLPKVLMLITGKGPLKEKYMKEVERLQSGEDGWKWVRCISVWLEAEDYPLLLGSADLGVCLHSSSSALDLPMKVVDMFGCGLPVCALNFACLDELVVDGKNGLVFNTPAQLAGQMEALLTSFPNNKALAGLRSSLLSQSKSSNSRSSSPARYSPEKIEDDQWEWNSWDDNWNKIMRPVVLRDAHHYAPWTK